MNLYIFEDDSDGYYGPWHAWGKGNNEEEARTDAAEDQAPHAESRPLERSFKLVATYPLAEPQTPLKPKETTFKGISKDKAEEFARRIMDFAQRNQMDCPSINDMAALILGTHPQPYPKKLSNPDWLVDCAEEIAIDQWGRDASQITIDDIADIIRKHAPK